MKLPSNYRYGKISKCYWFNECTICCKRKCCFHVLEVNPRASRTVPFVSKATGRPLAKIAARVMAELV